MGRRGVLPQIFPAQVWFLSLSPKNTKAFRSCSSPVAEHRLVTVKKAVLLVTCQFYQWNIMGEDRSRVKMLLYHHESCSVTPPCHLLAATLQQHSRAIPGSPHTAPGESGKRTPLNYQLLTSHFTTCVGIWVHKVSFYLPWKFNKDLFLFLLNSQLFLNKCRPCNGANCFPPPFIQAVGASKGCTDPENWGSALEHPTNSITYFKVTFKETFLDWNNCCQQLA